MATTTTTTTVSNGPDPYAYYESQGNGKSDGKGKGHPIVPEASSYGLFFMGLVIAALCLSRYLNRRITKSL